MLISKKWLQTHFQEELPPMQSIADTLLLHSFEVEGLEEKNGDWILDIDVLPNRAHDCLCHLGVAQELSGLLDTPLKEHRFSSYQDLVDESLKLDVSIDNPHQGYRYMGVRVENIEVRESPEWLKNRLSAMGQKSINTLVDATNFILFDLGQPMHVFDADKVKGGIFVRNARDGEMVLLGGEKINLTQDDLVIADEEKILALAGIKGGQAAELDSQTRNIIVESANFNPKTTRKTARRLKIATDASKRYENRISSEKATLGISAYLSLILELAATDETKIGKITDVYPHEEEVVILSLEHGDIERLLGFSLPKHEVEDILRRFRYQYTFDDEVYTIAIPSDRFDLRISADMIEELGRIYGYHKIPTVSIDEIEYQAERNELFNLSQALRNYFVSEGFFEIMNYTFVKKGEIDILNPLANDKRSLRKNLKKQMEVSLEKNRLLLDFMNLKQVKIFEIDRVHTKDGERNVLSFAIDAVSKKSRRTFGTEEEQLEEHFSRLEERFAFSRNDIEWEREKNVISINLDSLVEKASLFESDEEILQPRSYGNNDTFHGISAFPYMKRDVSFWVDDHSLSAEYFLESFSEIPLNFLQKIYLLDSFEKDGRVSYTFSFIFQSHRETLTDEMVNQEIEKIYRFLRNSGFEVR